MKKTGALALRWLGSFTLFGGAVLLLALIILVRSLITRNAYEIVLACGILLLMLILGITGVWKSRKYNEMKPGWKPPVPMTACAGDETYITGLEVSVPLFFRLHYSIRGRFFPCGCKDGDNPIENKKKRKIFSNGSSVSAETSVPRGNTSAVIELDFPMSGIFYGEGNCQLRDIFGFFSFSCGQPQLKTVNVRNSPCFGKKIHINAQSGAEDKRSKPSADEERYYMREYTPGDRLRDINWKSSDRIDTLITRISTDNQEKINRIEVYFRNYGQVELKKRAEQSNLRFEVSLEALWLLDRAKARLTYFIRSLMEQSSSFIFDVRTAQGNWEIEDMDDLDAFLEELAGLSFSPPKNEGTAPVNMGELYIFSTALDSNLPGFLLTCNPRPVTLFISQPKTGDTKGTETLYISDFIKKGCIPSVRWFRKNIKPLSVHTNKMEINYTELKI